MSKGVYIALSGAMAQESALETTASNVANSASAGYQRLRPIFRQALASAVNKEGGLRYVATQRNAVDTSLGPVRVTEKPLDLALPQGAYLTTTTPRGERYTRAGSLTIDKEGVLRTASGTALVSDAGSQFQTQPSGGPVTITPDGTVKQGASSLGKLKIVKFEKPDALEPEGGALMAVGNAGAISASTEPLTIGAFEESNSQPMSSMTELMTATRTFEAFQKVLDQFGEIDRKLLTSVPSPVE